LVLSAGLAACSGHDTAGGPRSSDDPTSLPSPPLPDTQRAESFLRRWAAAEVRMENTGHTSRFLAMSRKCGVCRSLARNIVRRYAAGGYVRWDGLHIDSIKAPTPSPGVMIFTIRGYSAPMTYRDSSSHPERHVRGDRVTYLVGVTGEPKSYGVTSWTSY
jgi:hypothetical protein